MILGFWFNTLITELPNRKKKKKKKKKKNRKLAPASLSSTTIMAEPTVRVSGIVLSSLMFQHVNRDSDVVRNTFICH